MSGSDIYTVVSQTAYLPFHYLDADGAPVTGKVGGDFTIEISKDGTGNQATTGCTITEIDATNNAGEYQVSCSGSTSFVTVVGTYEVTVYDTSNSEYRWVQTIRVANSNTYTGTTAEFTATAGDGRITASGSPLQDAVVTLIDGSGTRVTEVTSDAAGLWGPVYLSESVTGYVQADGYAQSTFAITVSGLTATGPGTDVAMTTATSVSVLKASELVAYARREAADRTGSKSDTVLLQIVNDAMQDVSRKTNSTFYETTYDITIEAKYDTGTLAVTNGSATVTLSGGTWPTSAASGVLSIDSKVYDISSRDSATQVTLRTAYVGTTNAALDEWTYVRTSYDLPENLYNITDMYYGRNWPWSGDPVSYNTFVAELQGYFYTQKFAHVWSIANQQIHLWPAPTDDDFITIVYYRRPAQLTALTQTADVDPNHIEILRRMISYHVALHYGIVEGGLDQDELMKAAMDTLVATANKDRNGQDWRSPLGRGGRRSVNRGVTNVPGS